MRAAMDATNLNPYELPEAQVRELTAQLIIELRHKQAIIEKLTHEMAVLKRLKYASKSEAFTGEQKSLLQEAIDEDLEALGREIEREKPAPSTTPAAGKQQPKRQPLPGHCRAARSATSRRRACAVAAVRSSASARTWPRSSTTPRACSPWSATSAASGCARSARR